VVILFPSGGNVGTPARQIYGSGPLCFVKF